LIKELKPYIGEKAASLTNGAGKTGRRLKLDPCLSLCTKINSK
jgi:hypothetical protein